jgi:hypothetical protein
MLKIADAIVQHPTLLRHLRSVSQETRANAKAVEIVTDYFNSLLEARLP